MKVLTHDEIVALATKIIDQRGRDWTYPASLDCPACREGDGGCEWHIDGGCRYIASSGEPACVVGCMLTDLGYTADDLRPHEARTVLEVLEGLNIDVPDRADRIMLIRLQSEQDSGKPWGEAFARAQHAYEQEVCEYDYA